MHAAGSSSTPPLAEVRFSTRRAGKIATYNEDGSDDFEDETDPTTVEYYDGAYEYDAPAIDLVLRHRLRDGSPDGQRRRDDYEYMVKWQGKSYYHATWEPYPDLASIRGSKKVKNYFDNIIGLELYMQNDTLVSLEDREQWNLDREQRLEALNDYVQVDRVIDMARGEMDTEYLVKWRGLNYDQCTWELASLVSRLGQQEIDRYLDRSSKVLVSNKTESNLHTRSAYRPFREQPHYIRNGLLREFQITGVNFLAHNWCRGDSVILADEMGLGKTVQTVAFLSWLRHERQQQGPFLVVVPLSTMPAWAETFDHWAPDTNYVIYVGNDKARTLIREKELFVDGNPRRTKFHVMLTTYDFITIKNGWTPDLGQVKWQFLAVDEAHRLKNQASQLYEKLMNLGAPSRLLITGTPIQNNLGELSALMSFLMPGKIIVDDDIDLASEAASHKLNELTQSISPYIIRRTKQKVESDLPPKTEKIIRVELSDIQLEYYKNILTRNYTALNKGGGGYKQSLLNIVIELKKASNHPFMFPGVEDRILNGSERKDDILKGLVTSSGKMMLLDQLLTKMKKDGHRVLIFSQMVRMLDILSDYLKARGHQFQRLDGTISAGNRRLAMDHFNAPDSKDFCFLLSTRAGGLGINLMTADTVILFDSDWNPQADLQAMARAHRIGQKNPVTVYRFVSKDTIEEEVIERARNKLMLEFITIQRGVTDKDTSNFKERMAEAKRVTEAPNDPDDINRILKRRGQKMFEQSGNQKKLEALDIDAVLENAEEHKTEQPEGLAADGGEDFLKSFEYTDVKVDLEWDEIIPKDQLEAIQAEERKKEEDMALKALIEENAPRKRKTTSEGREQRAAKRRAQDRAAAKLSMNDDDNDSSELSALDDDEVLDPDRPLDENETRRLIRAYERYGNMDEQLEDFLKEAKLGDRNVSVLRKTMDEISAICNARVKEEQDKLDQIERDERRPITKKDRKAVLFDYNGVQRLNAETLLERPREMHLLREVVKGVNDIKTFRVPEASKPAAYTSDWGAREDGMLVVGVSKYGYGAWVQIRDDPELGLEDKFFLDEHQVAQKDKRAKADRAEEKSLRSPGAVHLVRRINYLLNVLKDKTSGGQNAAARKALENHHRNTKKWGSSTPNGPDKLGRSSYSASPAPGTSQHRQRLDKMVVYEPNTGRPTKVQRPSKGHQQPLDRYFSDPREHNRHRQARSSDRRDAERNGPSRLTPSHRETERHRSSDHGADGLDKNGYDRLKSERSPLNGERHHHAGDRQHRADGSPYSSRKFSPQRQPHSEQKHGHRHRTESVNSVKLIRTTPELSTAGNGSEAKENHGLHSDQSGAESSLDLQVKEFLQPLSEELRAVLEGGGKKSGKSEAERSRILINGLTKAGDHIASDRSGHDEGFKAACW